MERLNNTIIIIAIIILISYSSLIAQETIIDSVYSDPLLDGDIIFSQNNQSLSVNNWMYDMSAGDSGESLIASDPNSIIRSYISFELPQIPDGYELDSVYVRLYQFFSVGDGDIWGNQEPFPLFYGEELPCIMDHIDYGDELDVSDWTKGDLGDPGTLDINIGCISNYEDIGYRYLNITEYVLNDYNNSRDKTQYRIRFEVNTDWDNLTDDLGFKTSNSTQIQQHPLVLIHFISYNSTDDYTIHINKHLKIYPNPFNSETTISYQISNNSNVLLQIFNTKGQLIEAIVNEIQNAGKYSVIWNAENHSSGLYFYKITVETQSVTGKCLLLK